jgi:hypothetical protein
LSDEALAWHPRLGIHAANVAPEFGVAETRALFEVMEANGLQEIASRFEALAVGSRKWEKWMLPGSRATDRERALICGHYVFANPECIALKEQAAAALRPRGIELEDHLKGAVRASILRYLRNFRLVRPS